ncbi:hypothetical protein [uncultured Tateyamaria sp.]|uniref:hypothetical protein n=1 Tax=Tateyamaria sp. 1078 TaxID=3417464 RepID=UPI00261CD35F|nr:hypothetical protein [uncultured Tateyamaria sp.]
MPQLLLDAQRAYNDEIYQNLMAYAAQLQVLGILAGVIDGPTEEYRAAVAEAAGNYFDHLLERSQRTHWTQNSSPLDAGSTMLGLWYQALGGIVRGVSPDDTYAQRVGEDWSAIGDRLRTTDPDNLISNVGADMLQSLWDACEARWDQFWDDFDNEGLMSAMARLRADADFLAAELAIDVALAVATGGAAAAIRIVARRVSATASRVVIRAVNVASNAVPDADIIRVINLPDADIDQRIVRQVLDEENLRTRSQRGDLTERAEVENPSTERPSGSAGATREPDPVFRHPREGDTPRSRDELLTNGRVPGARRFNAWFDDLSPAELDDLWSDPTHQRAIRNRLLNGGRHHEWLMRSRAPHLKRLGFTADDIMEFVDATDGLSGPVPGRPGERWSHRPQDGGPGSGPNSGNMHNALGDVIDNATTRNGLLRALGDFAEDWLDDGVASFPESLRNAINAAGG